MRKHFIASTIVAAVAAIFVATFATAQPSPGFSKTPPIAGTGSNGNPLKITPCAATEVYRMNAGGTAWECVAGGAVSLTVQDCASGSFFDRNTAGGVFTCEAEVGDISSVGAGSGLINGGTSGAVVVDAVATTNKMLTVLADSIGISDCGSGSNGLLWDWSTLTWSCTTWPTLADALDGSGTLNRHAKFTPDGDTLGDSLTIDNGTTWATTASTLVQMYDATTGVAGLAIVPSGDVFVDFKMYSGGDIDFRLGENNQAASAVTWLVVDGSTGNMTIQKDTSQVGKEIYGTDGIFIKDDNISTGYLTASTDSLNFNRGGYLDGAGNYRNTIVYDGKANPLLSITGATGAAVFTGAVSIGDAAGDAHVLLGTVNANATAGTNGQILQVSGGVPIWAAPSTASITTGAGTTNTITKWTSSTAIGNSLWADTGTSSTYNTNKFFISATTGDTLIAGSLGVTGSIATDGAAILGNAAGDAHATLGTWNFNATAGTNGQILQIVGGVPVWGAVSAASGVTGTGTANTMTKWTGTTTIGNSLWTESGTSTIYNTNKFYIEASSGDTLIAGVLGVTGLVSGTAGFTTGANYTTTGTGDVVSADAITSGGNATLGDSAAADTHAINGTTTLTGRATSNPLTVNLVASAATTSPSLIDSNSTGTYNTTAGALINYASDFSTTATRSAGAFDLTNIAVYANASGAQVNYAWFGNAGLMFQSDAATFNSTVNAAGLVTGTLGFTTPANFTTTGTGDIVSADDVTATDDLFVLDDSNLGNDSTDLTTLVGTLTANATTGSIGQILYINGSTLPAWGAPSSASLPTGTGAANTMTKWTGTNTIGNSSVTDNGSVVTASTILAVDVGASGAASRLTGTNLEIEGAAATDNYITMRTPNGVNGGLLFNTPTGAAQGYILYEGTAQVLGLAAGGLQVLQVRPAYVTASNMSAGQTVDVGVLIGRSLGSFDTTAAQRVAYGVEGVATSTRSSGANNLINVGLYGFAANGQDNRGLWVNSGASQLDGTLTVNGASSLGSTLDVTGLITATAGGTTAANWTTTGAGDLVSADDLTVADDTTLTDTLTVNGNTTLGNATTDTTAINGTTTVTAPSNGQGVIVNNAQTAQTSGTANIYVAPSGTYNTTASGLNALGVWVNQTSSRSSGANPLNNVGFEAVISGAQNNTAFYADASGGSAYSFYGAAGTLYNAGPTGFAGTLAVAGNTTLGDATSDTTTISGDLFVSAGAVEGLFVTGKLGSAPTVGTCGTSPTIDAKSTNIAGKFTTGSTTGTSCTLTFNGTWPGSTIPICWVTTDAAGTGKSLITPTSTTTTTMVMTTQLVSSTAYAYMCFGGKT